MRQRPLSGRDRRSEPRQPKAFALWVQRVGHADRTSAWMLDVSVGGAAFLVPRAEAPAVGELVEFSEMPTTDPFVREGALPLPTLARVLRHDTGEGLTRRVAVRFEADLPARLAGNRHRVAAACRSHAGRAHRSRPPQSLRLCDPLVGRYADLDCLWEWHHGARRASAGPPAQSVRTSGPARASGSVTGTQPWSSVAFAAD